MPKKYSIKSSRKYARSDRSVFEWLDLHPDTVRGILITVLVLLSALSLLSFFHLAGSLGDGIRKALLYGFGWGRYLFPVYCLIPAWMLFQDDRFEWNWGNTVGFTFFILSFSGLLQVFIPEIDATSRISIGEGGGYIGYAISLPLIRLMGVWGAFVLLLAIFIIALLLVFRTSLHSLVSVGGFFTWLGDSVFLMIDKVRDLWAKWHNHETGEEAEGPAMEEIPENSENPTPSLPLFHGRLLGEEQKNAPLGEQSTLPLENKPARTPQLKMRLSLDLLDENATTPTSGNIDRNKEMIQRTLENFGIVVEMGEVSIGPTVTQYTLKPDEGVKLAQITTLQNDLALALAAHPIRIEAPIPGKSLVGIEIPNQKVSMVRLKEILEADTFKKRNSNFAISLGKDVGGNAVITHLDKMPHLLIAGATGSGKSVMINALILSLLFQNTPEQLRLILVDPKRVEMTVYNDIPYLLTPVITDPKKTVNALRWLVSEMDRRYQVLEQAGQRNLESYNRTAAQPMPYIVLIIDELADLMAVAANDVEAAIVRLAQMARAVGIHLVVATQRPSVDVITGLIKANITSRIAFTVASLVDSRTILDTSGAEKLLGRGDMLFVSADAAKPRRIQGVFVSDQEISRVTSFLKQQGQPEYDEQVTTKPHNTNIPGFDGDDADDSLTEEAGRVVIEAGKASASLLQRRLRVGYARAARLLDILEERGMIGPADGAKPREVLVNSMEDFQLPPSFSANPSPKKSPDASAPDAPAQENPPDDSPA